MSVWITFIQGLFMGVPYGVLFNIPKLGRMILLGGACAVGMWLIFDPSIMVDVFSYPWYMNAANFLGMIIGQLFGGFLLNRILEEWGIKH